MDEVASMSIWFFSNSQDELADQNQYAVTSNGRSFSKLVAALLVTVLIISAVAVGLFTLQSEATIPLSINYQVGEKMVYDATIGAEMQIYNSSSTTNQTALTPNRVTTDATITTNVIDFDGEIYTLNQTTTMNLLGKTQSMSIIQMVNKTGFSTFMLNSPTDTSSYSMGSNSLYNTLLDKPDVKVGESIQVPIEGLKGNITLTFSGIEELSVPAGNYKVYKVTFYSDNLAMENQIPESLGVGNIQVSMSMNGTMYIEYGSGRQIQCSLHSTTSSEAAGAIISFDMTYDVILSEHTQPAK
jgi:hypothetical protein